MWMWINIALLLLGAMLCIDELFPAHSVLVWRDIEDARQVIRDVLSTIRDYRSS